MATGNALLKLMSKDFLDFCIVLNALDIAVNLITGYYEYKLSYLFKILFLYNIDKEYA